MNKCRICGEKIIPSWVICRDCDEVSKEEVSKPRIILDEHVQLMGEYSRLTELYSQQQTLIEMLMKENAYLKELHDL